MKRLSIMLSFCFVFFCFFVSVNADTFISESQKQVIRDTKRLNDITILKTAIENYKTKNGFYPKLDSGTNIKGYVNSLWPNQWKSFCSLIGLTNCPVDPINEVIDCSCATFNSSGVCSGDNNLLNIDRATCYNAKTESFACSLGSRLYQYQSLNNSRNYSLMMEFEYSDSVNWNIPSTASDNILITSNTCVSGNNYFKVMSNSLPRCGDGVLSLNEECEAGSKKMEFCNTVDGKKGVKYIPCSSSCVWDSSNAGSCLNTGFCGDSILQKDKGEECDGGYQKMCYDYQDYPNKNVSDKYASNSHRDWYDEQIRYCGQNCKWSSSFIDSTSYCGGFCGDGIIQKSQGEECDDSNDIHCSADICKFKNSSPKISFDFYSNRNSLNSYIKSSVWTGGNLQYQDKYLDSNNVDLIIADKQGSDYVAIWNSDFIEIKVSASDVDGDDLFYKYSFEQKYNNGIKIKYKNSSGVFVDYVDGDYVSSDTIRIYPISISSGSNTKNSIGAFVFGSSYNGYYDLKVEVSDKYNNGLASATNLINPVDVYDVKFKIGSGCGDGVLNTDLGEICELKPNETQNNIFTNWSIGKPDSGTNGYCVISSFSDGGRWDDVSCSNSYYGLCERRASFGCNGWIKGDDDNCYLFTSRSENWSDAKNECQSYNGKLVVIDEVSESLFLKNNTSISSKNAFWIGYNFSNSYWSAQYDGKWGPALTNKNSFRTKFFGLGTGNDVTNQYSCGLPWSNKSCKPIDGFCGDGIYNPMFEECDFADKTSYGKGSSQYNPYECNNKKYSCTNTSSSNYLKNKTYNCSYSLDSASNPDSLNCRLSGGYCGDSYLESNYEHCDPKDRIIATSSGSSNFGLNPSARQYVCKSVSDYTDYKSNPYNDVDDYNSTKNNNVDRACRKSYGGYCGDGSIQMFYSLDSNSNYVILSDNVNAQSDNIWKKILYDKSVNKNYFLNGTDKAYFTTDQENMFIEECDPAGFAKATPASSSITNQYGSCGDNDGTSDLCVRSYDSHGNLTLHSGNCACKKLTSGYCGDNYLQSSFGEKCENVSTNSELVGWLKFNNDSTNSAISTITSTPAGLTYLEGKYGKAGVFDGSSSVVSLSSLDLNNSAGAKNTVSFWMKWNGVNNAMPIGFSSYDLYISSNNFGFNTGNSDVLGIPFSSYANKWVYVTAIFYNGTPNASNSSIYINGVKQSISLLVGTSSVSRTVSSSAKISGWNNDSNHRFSGMIDDVRFYNRDLTSSEILSIYNKGSFGKYYFDIYNNNQDVANVSNASCTSVCGTVGDGWTCDSDYYWSSADNNCIPVPSNSVKIGTVHGGDDYKCNASFEKDGLGGCVACDNGEYSVSGGVCSPCTAIANSNWISNGTAINNCQFNCKIAYSYDGTARTCTVCPSGKANPEANQNNTCSNCVDTRSNSQIYSANNSSGSCPISNCTAGQYPSSVNGGYMNKCSSCTTLSGSYTWSSPGENCNFTCNQDYYQSASNTCSKCDAEYWTASGNNSSSCTPCHYTSWNGLSCNSGKTWSGTRTRTDGDDDQCTYTITTDSGSGSCDYCFPISSTSSTACSIANATSQKDRSCKTNLTWDVYGSCYVTSCNAGYYPSSTDTCTSCPEGNYCPGGMSTYLTCPVGKYCPAGSSAGTNCLAGTYRSSTGGKSQADCSNCTQGYYCNAGSTSATQNACTAGNYCPAGSGSQSYCSAGTYDNDSNTTTACLTCPAGKYCTGGIAIGNCTQGYYCPAGSSSATQNPCPAGQYCPTSSGSPTNCLAGTYRSSTLGVSQSDCSNCTAGYYCNAGSTSATQNACTAGNYCPAGSGSQSYCSAGTYDNDSNTTTACSACTAGYFCTGGTARSACTAIANRSTWTNANATSNATCSFTCNANYYYDGTARTCTVCAGESYTAASNTSTSCSACVYGSWAGQYCAPDDADPDPHGQMVSTRGITSGNATQCTATTTLKEYDCWYCDNAQSTVIWYNPSWSDTSGCSEHGTRYRSYVCTGQSNSYMALGPGHLVIDSGGWGGCGCNATFGGVSCNTCATDYVGYPNCTLRTCNFPSDYESYSTPQQCQSDSYWDYYYVKKATSNCAVPGSPAAWNWNAYTYADASDNVVCRGTGDGAWDCAIHQPGRGRDCWYCDPSWGKATTTVANDANCNSRGTGNYSMNCTASTMTWPGWSLDSCSCNTGYYGSSCESSCVYGNFTTYDTICTSGDILHYYQSRTVAGSNCASAYNEYDGAAGTCDYCTADNQCPTTKKSDNNTCSSGYPSCSYGYARHWNSGEWCIGCCDDRYSDCYHNCDETNRWCTSDY